MLALLMAWLGFKLATPGQWPLLLLGATFLGIACVGISCGILNQYIEREIDLRMERTRQRPLPQGRVSERAALVVGWVFGIVGVATLYFWVNGLTAFLGVMTLWTYLGLYTPLKRYSSFSTIVGAIPGALPPVMGWTAATGRIGWEGLALFALLFIWQIPHFLSIAWIYREDYARASFPILTVVDAQGRLASIQVVLYSIVLIPVSLLPTLHGVTGTAYFYGAAILGILFAGFGARWAWHRSLSTARQLFLVSILYLPMLGALLLWDRQGY